jgi:periplasmic copper chaperone A
MKSSMHIAIAAALIFACCSGAGAKNYQAGSLHIETPWARATPKGVQIGGGYVVIKNEGKEADALIGASLMRASRTEMHQMKMDNGIMEMRPVTGGIDIKPGATITLDPGGYHFMFMGLKEPLKEGDLVQGTLVFKRAGTVPVEFEVEGIGAKAPTGSEDKGSK